MRSPSSRGEVRDIKAHGAKGDGVTDDAPAINAAIQAAGTSVGAATDRMGARLVLPPGRYRCASDIVIDKFIILEGATGGGRYGATILDFEDGNRLHIKGPPAGQAFPSGAGSVVHHLYLNSKSYGGAQAPNIDGIYCEVAASIRDCMVVGFSRHGIHVDGTTEDRNANYWSAIHCRMENNAGWGLYAAGVNANGGIGWHCESVSNGGGFRIASFLGSKLDSCLVEATYDGGYRTAQAYYVDGDYSVLSSCYSESDNAPSYLGPNVMSRGGDHGAGWSDYDGMTQWAALTAVALNNPIRVPTANNGHFYRATVAGTTAASEPTWPTTPGATVVDGGVTWKEMGLCNEGFHQETKNNASKFQVIAKRGSNGAKLQLGTTNGVLGWSSDITGNQVELAWEYQRSRWWEFVYGGQVLLGISDDGAAEGAGLIGFPSGLGIAGSGVAFKKIKEGLAAPTSGTWNAGDIMLNGDPSAGGFIGWVCVTSGTPGTWKTFGAISP